MTEGVAKRAGTAAALAGLVWLGGVAAGGAQTTQDGGGGGSVKPMPSAGTGSAAAAAQQAGTGPSAELAPGIVFEVVELRRMPERGFMQLRFAVNNTTNAGTPRMPAPR